MMRRIVILLLILGFGSFVLPVVGLQFKLFTATCETAQAIAGAIMAAIGAFLLYAARVRDD